MKSLFIRFHRCARSPLSLATVGLGTLWGCQHLPNSRHTTEHAPPVYAPSVPVVGSYEEPSVANSTDNSANLPPIVSLSEGETFLSLPNKPVLPANTPPLANAEPPKSESPVVDVTPTAKEELPAADLPSMPPAVIPKLKVPPEPTPTDELDFDSDNQPKAEGNSKTEAKEVALVDNYKPALPIESRNSASESVATLENEVFSLDSYCDGLVFDAQGFGYVSHKDRIVRFSPTGESSVWTTFSHPKGHRIEPEGTHLVCDLERRAVLRLSFEGKLIGVAAKDCDGVPFRAPYDIAVDPKGGFYFTDPGYVQIEHPIGKLHFVDRTGKVSVVAAKIGYPTGVVYDATRQRVLVAESQFNRILEFRLSEPGKAESHEVFVQLPKSPDTDYHLASLCLDGEGNLFVTQQQTKTVHVFDQQGRPSGRFTTGTVVPSSVALRSADAGELFFAGEVESRTRSGKVMRLNLGR